MALTPKQERFCQEYIKDMNASRSALAAGYSEHTAPKIGSENLQKPEVSQRIAELQRPIAEKAIVDATYVLTSLKAIAERCMQAELVSDKDGVTTGEYKFDAAGANRALELLGKHLVLFTDRVKVDADVSLNMQFGGE